MSTKTREHHHHNQPHHQAKNAQMTAVSAENPVPAKQKISEEERSRLIEVCAYGLWQQAGKPDGDAARQRFWCEAEKKIMSQSKNE